MAHELCDPVHPAGDLQAVTDPALQLVGELHSAEGLGAGAVLAVEHEVADPPVESTTEPGAVVGEVALAGRGIDEGVDGKLRQVTRLAEEAELGADVEVAEAAPAIQQVGRQ